MHILDNIEKRKLSIESQVEVLQHTIGGKLHAHIESQPLKIAQNSNFFRVYIPHNRKMNKLHKLSTAR